MSGWVRAEGWGRGGEGAADRGGGSGRREVGVEGGCKRAMGRLKMAG